MKGYWLSRNETLFATQKTPYAVDRLLSNCERRGEGKKKQYFIPQTECTEEYLSKNIPAELDEEDILNQLDSNVDFNQDDHNQINIELKKARKEKIIRETKLLEEKLALRKRELFTEWSQNFFNVFADSFGKLRNTLINMHLNEEQISIFNDSLDHCINNLELHLSEVWTEFNNEEELKNEKED